MAPRPCLRCRCVALSLDTRPGLLKLNVINVPAKKRRSGIDPFTKRERVFAAKPTTMKVRALALMKLRNVAL